MAENFFSEFRSAIKSYIYMPFTFTSGKNLKKLLQLVTPQFKYELLISTKQNGALAMHKAATLKESFHHSVLLRCMMNGLTPEQKYNLLVQQNEPYGNNVLHLLVTKNGSEIMATIAYLLDDLEIDQRQRLVYMKNTAGETVLDRAHKNTSSSAIPNLLIEKVARTTVLPSAPPASPQQLYNFNPLNMPPGESRTVPAADAPPSYETVLLEQAMSVVTTHTPQRADSFTPPCTERSVKVAASSDQRLTELQVKCTQLQDMCVNIEREKNEQIKELSAKLRAAEGNMKKRNLVLYV